MSMKARPEETVMMVAWGCFRKCGSSAAVRRIGPRRLEVMVASAPPAVTDPKLEVLVREIIERVADKWTMLVLEVLEEHGVVRFTRLGELVGGREPEDADQDGAADGARRFDNADGASGDSAAGGV
jgi:hypothetical protein